MNRGKMPRGQCLNDEDHNKECGAVLISTASMERNKVLVLV
jgi:hypothetical protein